MAIFGCGYGLSSCDIQAPEHADSVVVRTGLVVLWRVASWFPDQGSNLHPPTLQGTLPTTGPLEKSLFQRWYYVVFLVPLGIVSFLPPLQILIAILKCFIWNDFRFL